MGTANECGSCVAEDGDESSASSSSSSTAPGSPWSHASSGSVDFSEDLIAFVGESRILSPAVSTVLSRVSSVTTEGDSSIEGGVGHDTVRDIGKHIDISIDIVGDSDGDGDSDGVMRVAEDNGTSGCIKNQLGGSSVGSRSTGSYTIGETTGLNGRRARCLASGRDADARQQSPQPQSTEHSGDKYIVRTRWGGWCEVDRGTSAAAGARCRNSSRAVAEQKKVVVHTTGGGTGGDGPANAPPTTVLKNKNEPCMGSGEYRRRKHHMLLCAWFVGNARVTRPCAV